MKTASAPRLPPAIAALILAVAQNLRRSRLARGDTQRHAAERLFVSLRTYQRLEQGDPAVSFGMIASACELYGLGEGLRQLADPLADSVASATLAHSANKRARRITTKANHAL